MFIDSPLATNALGVWSDQPGSYERDAGARVLYERVYRQSLLSRIRRLLGRRSALLQPLPEGQFGQVQRPGTLTVPIRAIRGSENRCRDFDGQFRPLRGHTKERWISVAAARLRGLGLPPVELLEVGESYYVRDGHHRISVAQALGEEYVEAVVTVCA